MAYDESLAARVRDLLAADPALSERKVFGGLAFMLGGNMCCGIVGDRLMLRLGEDRAAQALKRPSVHPMDFTGRPMTGMVYVEPEGLRGKALRTWVEQAVGFANAAAQTSTDWARYGLTRVGQIESARGGQAK